MFALNVFGPAYEYRLDILADACPNITKYIYVLTDKVSYEKFYKHKYESIFNFVFIEDMRDAYPLSIEHEILPNIFETAEQQFREQESFYIEKNNNFSFDIHRFIFPYFLEKGIKKFFIIDSDCIPTNNVEDVEYFFNNLPEKSIFSPSMGYYFRPTDDVSNNPRKFFWNSIGVTEYTRTFTLDDKIHNLDGWVRGFNFDTLEDMKEFFDLWNTAYLTVLDERFSKLPIYKNGEGPMIWSSEWVTADISRMFELYKGYTHNVALTIQPGIIWTNSEFNSPSNYDKSNLFIAIHAPRPEDNLYYTFNGRRGAWWDYKFDYNNIKTTSEFVKKNKEELYRYYSSRNFSQTIITDTHAYTRTSL